MNCNLGVPVRRAEWVGRLPLIESPYQSASFSKSTTLTGFSQSHNQIVTLGSTHKTFVARSQSNCIPVRITPRLRPPRQRLPHQLTINNQSQSKARIPRVHRHNYSNLVKIPTMKTQQPKSPHFKLVHLNIRSLRNTAHLTQLKEFLLKAKTEALTAVRNVVEHYDNDC